MPILDPDRIDSVIQKLKVVSNNSLVGSTAKEYLQSISNLSYLIGHGRLNYIANLNKTLKEAEEWLKQIAQ